MEGLTTFAKIIAFLILELLGQLDFATIPAMVADCVVLQTRISSHLIMQHSDCTYLHVQPLFMASSMLMPS